MSNETALAPLIDAGYSLAEMTVYKEFSGDTVIILHGAIAHVRIRRERLEWFAEFSRATEPPEWFDSYHVYRYIGRDPPAPCDSLLELVQKLLDVRTGWEPLFRADIYPETRSRLKQMQRDWARQEFGYEGD